jgi:isoquinoline 1-oxidoreductase beta subunit
MTTMTATNPNTGYGLSRRQFIVTSLTATGGFALGIAAPGLGQAATLDVRPWGDEAAHAGEINAWIVVEPDDTVIIRYSRAEMGQAASRLCR